MEHVLQLGSVFLIHDHQLVVQNAHDTVVRAVHLGDVLVLQAGLDDAVRGAVDNGGRAAGLADDQRADKRFLRHCMLPPNS